MPSQENEKPDEEEVGPVCSATINEDLSPVVPDASAPRSSRSPNICLHTRNKLCSNNAISKTAEHDVSNSKIYGVPDCYFRSKYTPLPGTPEMVYETLVSSIVEKSPKHSLSTNLKRASECFSLILDMFNDGPKVKKMKFTMNKTTKNENLGENYFDCLPSPIVEKILCQLPFLKLMKVRTVCKLWNEVINESRFLEWKKTYYDVKFKHGASPCWKNAVSYFNSETVTVGNCLSVLISFMGDKFVRKPPKGLETYLNSIPSCITAKHLLLERFSKQPLLCENPWCILTVTVILSPIVEDLYDIFNQLINVYYCNYDDMLEAMFCMATILLHLMRTFSINPGAHYRLYNVIYWLENKGPINGTVFSVQPQMKLQEQQSLQNDSCPLDLKMTHEQVQILNHELAVWQIIKICSFAGTGKTTTLMQFAKKHSNLKFLYLVCKEPSCEYVASRCPSNVVCKTLNLMAYEAVGKRYKHKLADKLDLDDILPFVHKWPSFSNCCRKYAECVLKTIKAFIQSKMDHLSAIHVRCSDSKLEGRLSLFNQTDSCTFNRKALLHLIILNEANEVWKKMVSEENEACKITPGIYLKLFQLSEPCLSDYDCIMIDEAEDFSEVMLSITLSQQVPVILSGDPNQQMVELKFPNNLHTWTSVNASHTYHLTKSFRFGPEIAYVTNCCFEVLTSKTGSTVVGSLKESYIDGTIKGQYAVIAYTFKSLFMEAFRLCCTTERHPNEPIDFKGAFVGGIPHTYLDQLIDIYKLKDNNPNSDIKDEFIKKFIDFAELEYYAKRKNDTDIIKKIKIVEEFDHTIVNIIDIIKQKCSHDIAVADVVFSTTHNAKGLEFDTVRWVGDFSSQDISNLSYFLVRLHHSYFGRVIEDCFGQQDRHNNVYISLTRAKTCLVFSEDVFFTLLLTQEKFEYLVPSSALLENLQFLQCASCSKTFSPFTVLTMVCRNLTLASGRQIQGGPLCLECSTSPHYTNGSNLRPELLPPSEDIDIHHISMAGFIGQLTSD